MIRGNANACVLSQWNCLWLCAFTCEQRCNYFAADTLITSDGYRVSMIGCEMLILITVLIPRPRAVTHSLLRNVSMLAQGMRFCCSSVLGKRVDVA